MRYCLVHPDRMLHEMGLLKPMCIACMLHLPADEGSLDLVVSEFISMPFVLHVVEGDETGHYLVSDELVNAVPVYPSYEETVAAINDMAQHSILTAREDMMQAHFERDTVEADIGATEYVSKYYEMDPEFEDVVFSGNDLVNGMIVLAEDPIARADDLNEDEATDREISELRMRNRWATVTDLTVTSDQTRFVAVYSDGTKRKRTLGTSHAWLVKKDSMPQQGDDDSYDTTTQPGREKLVASHVMRAMIDYENDSNDLLAIATVATCKILVGLTPKLSNEAKWDKVDEIITDVLHQYMNDGTHSADHLAKEATEKIARLR